MKPDTEPNGSHEQPQNRRFTYAQRLLASLRHRRRQALLYFTCLVVLFAFLGIAQNRYLHFTLEQTSMQVLAAGADEIASEIDYKNGWDLNGYRNAAPNIERGFVLASDGLIVEVVGELVSGVLGPVRLIEESVFDSPKSVVSSVGENWRLLGSPEAS